MLNIYYEEGFEKRNKFGTMYEKLMVRYLSQRIVLFTEKLSTH